MTLFSAKAKTLFILRQVGVWCYLRIYHVPLTSAYANPSGYCFGGPFSIEIAATDNVAAGLCSR